jgi:hypothetical protein
MPACSGVLWRFEKRKPPFEIGSSHLGRLQRSAVVSSQQFLLKLNSPHLSKIACGTPFLEHAVADREERGAQEQADKTKRHCSSEHAQYHED